MTRYSFGFKSLKICEPPVYTVYIFYFIIFLFFKYPLYNNRKKLCKSAHKLNWLFLNAFPKHFFSTNQHESARMYLSTN